MSAQAPKLDGGRIADLRRRLLDRRETLLPAARFCLPCQGTLEEAGR
jgi:hypothetical protein